MPGRGRQRRRGPAHGARRVGGRTAARRRAGARQEAAATARRDTGQPGRNAERPVAGPTLWIPNDSPTPWVLERRGTDARCGDRSQWGRVQRDPRRSPAGVAVYEAWRAGHGVGKSAARRHRRQRRLPGGLPGLESTPASLREHGRGRSDNAHAQRFGRARTALRQQRLGRVFQCAWGRADSRARFQRRGRTGRS
jgi:hypothetical protein